MLVAIVVIVSWSVVRAQQPQEPSVSSQPTDKKSRYLLETYITPQLGPTYLLISGVQKRGQVPVFTRDSFARRRNQSRGERRFVALNLSRFSMVRRLKSG